jgi:hypothetical protein
MTLRLTLDFRDGVTIAINRGDNFLLNDHHHSADQPRQFLLAPLRQISFTKEEKLCARTMFMPPEFQHHSHVAKVQVSLGHALRRVPADSVFVDFHRLPVAPHQPAQGCDKISFKAHKKSLQPCLNNMAASLQKISFGFNRQLFCLFDNLDSLLI